MWKQSGQTSSLTTQLEHTNGHPSLIAAQRPTLQEHLPDCVLGGHAFGNVAEDKGRHFVGDA